MFEREVTEELKSWKKRRKRSCLLVRGARQIGKTYSIETFGKAEYKSFIEVNFLQTPVLKEIFSENLDVETLLTNFSVYMPEAKFIPGKTLLFLDEIQECPEAITSLKFWVSDKRFDVIASGSMLGIDYNRPTSYPVGSMSYIDMTSLNFREFLRAAGIKENILELLKKSFMEHTKVPAAIHNKIMELLRLYMAVGGMPEVVSLYFSENSMSAADEKQRDILNDYRYDIAHYAAGEIKTKAENCYFSLPDQLSKANHKFQYSILEKGGNARKFAGSIDWLIAADIVKPCYNVSAMRYPLQSYKDEANFRLYPSDIGLLVGMYDYSLKAELLKTQDDKRKLGEAKGGIYEALIADMLQKNGHDKLYFRKNEQATFELEFLIENEDGIIPVEVKAGNSRSRSLDTALEKDGIPYGYKLITGNVGESGKKITLPLYMAMFI